MRRAYARAASARLGVASPLLACRSPKIGNDMNMAEWQAPLACTSQYRHPGDRAVRRTVVAGNSNPCRAEVAGTSQVCNGTDGNKGSSGLATVTIAGANATRRLRAWLNRHNFDPLNQIQGHLDSSSTWRSLAAEIDAMSRGRGAAHRDITDDLQGRGQRLAQSADGRRSCYR